MRGPRSTRDRLVDIRDAISKARSAAAGMTFEAFSQNWMNQFAAERAIEIISEASRHIPENLKSSAPEIPWRDIADIGNILRHVYHKSDPEVVWRVVEFDLDPLEKAVVVLLEKIQSD